MLIRLVVQGVSHYGVADVHKVNAQLVCASSDRLQSQARVVCVSLRWRDDLPVRVGGFSCLFAYFGQGSVGPVNDERGLYAAPFVITGLLNALFTRMMCDVSDRVTFNNRFVEFVGLSRGKRMT